MPRIARKVLNFRSQSKKRREDKLINIHGCSIKLKRIKFLLTIHTGGAGDQFDQVIVLVVVVSEERRREPETERAQLSDTQTRQRQKER